MTEFPEVVSLARRSGAAALDVVSGQTPEGHPAQYAYSADAAATDRVRPLIASGSLARLESVMGNSPVVVCTSHGDGTLDVQGQDFVLLHLSSRGTAELRDVAWRPITFSLRPGDHVILGQGLKVEFQRLVTAIEGLPSELRERLYESLRLPSGMQRTAYHGLRLDVVDLELKRLNRRLEELDPRDSDRWLAVGERVTRWLTVVALGALLLGGLAHVAVWVGRSAWALWSPPDEVVQHQPDEIVPTPAIEGEVAEPSAPEEVVLPSTEGAPASNAPVEPKDQPTTQTRKRDDH